jgi:hypothetical protein
MVLVEPTYQALASGLRRALTMQPIYPAVVEEYDLPRLVARYEAVLENAS